MSGCLETLQISDRWTLQRNICYRWRLGRDSAAARRTADAPAILRSGHCGHSPWTAACPKQRSSGASARYQPHCISHKYDRQCQCPAYCGLIFNCSSSLFAAPFATVSTVRLFYGIQSTVKGPTPSQSITISNSGDALLYIPSLSLLGEHASHFGIASDTLQNPVPG